MTSTPHTSGDSVAAPTISEERVNRIAAILERYGYTDDAQYMLRLRSASAEPRAAVATVARDERMSPVEGVGSRLIATNEDDCPSDKCSMCNGSACNKCGAGCWNNNVTDCEHDSCERHDDPEIAPAATAPPSEQASPVEAPTGEKEEARAPSGGVDSAAVATREEDQAAREDMAFYNGARAYRALVDVRTERDETFPVSRQAYDLSRADQWLNSGAGGRKQQAKAALRTDTAPGLPAQAAKPPTCGVTEDAARLLWFANDIGVDQIGDVDLHERSSEYASAHGGEPKPEDFLRAVRDAIDAARLSKGERGRGEAPLSRGDPA